MESFASLVTRTALLLAVLSTTACGFHLRGMADISFRSLYIQHNGVAAIATEIKRNLRSNGVEVVGNPEDAELHLELMSEALDKRILSLSGGGRVREFELLYRVSFRIRARGSETWGAPQLVEGRRDYTYDDSLLLAKEGEEQRLYNDMRVEATREILRRLNAAATGKSGASR